MNQRKLLPSIAVASALLVVLLAAAIVPAQSDQGSVWGYLYSGLSHSRINGAAVSWKIVRDERGDYQFTEVPMGEYTLRITARNQQSYETTILILSDSQLAMGTRPKKQKR